MIRGLTLILCLALISACDTKADNTLPVELGSDYFFLSDDGATFQLDSIIFDPAPGGTARLTTSYEFRGEIVESTEDSQLCVFTAINSQGVAAAQQFWSFNRVAAGYTHSIDGATYFTLPTVLNEDQVWDPLVFGQREVVVSIAGEPVEINKSWSATLDSLADYEVSTGEFLPAAYVTLSKAENFVELRLAKEVYVKNLGLVERSLDILDTQNINSTQDWDAKAERGFRLRMKRIF